MLELLATRRRMLVGLIALLAVGSLGIWGCADHPTEYENPADAIVTTHTPTALIDAATLAEWIDEGRLNSTDAGSRDKIVLLTVAPKANYDAGHIAGSQLWSYDTELFQTRLEGVAAMSTMVPAGQNLDALLQRFGIDEHTTVVFTASTTRDLREATRGWFTLRYWGFPKDRLKVLQGGDVGWTTAGYSLVTEVPTVAASTFSIRDLAATSAFAPSLRNSIGEIIAAVDGLNSGALTGEAILDVRGGVDPVAGGRLQPAGLDSWNNYYVTGTTATLKPVDEILTHLATFGVTEATAMTHVYCQSGVKASVVFFVLDGVLDWPVQMYDGSWGQWSNYANTTVATAWRTDANTSGTTTSRSFGTWTPGTIAIDPVSNAAYSSIFDGRANQIESEDAAYFSSGVSTPPPGGGGGGGGSGC